jgi:hypothetical protein
MMSYAIISDADEVKINLTLDGAGNGFGYNTSNRNGNGLGYTTENGDGNGLGYATGNGCGYTGYSNGDGYGCGIIFDYGSGENHDYGSVSYGSVYGDGYGGPL